MNRPFMPNGDLVDTEIMTRYDVDLEDLSGVGIMGEEDLMFVAFSLEHAGCGDRVVEVRVGEHTILEWCTACCVMEVFGRSQM